VGVCICAGQRPDLRNRFDPIRSHSIRQLAHGWARASRNCSIIATVVRTWDLAGNPCDVLRAGCELARAWRPAMLASHCTQRIIGERAERTLHGRASKQASKQAKASAKWRRTGGWWAVPCTQKTISQFNSERAKPPCPCLAIAKMTCRVRTVPTVPGAHGFLTHFKDTFPLPHGGLGESLFTHRALTL